MPRVLSLKRSVQGPPGAWAFGKEFVSLLRRYHLPMMEARRTVKRVHLGLRGQVEPAQGSRLRFRDTDYLINQHARFKLFAR